MTFLSQHNNMHFVGDAYHYELVKQISNELFHEIAIESVFIKEDKLMNTEDFIEAIRKVSGDMPILIGVYNVANRIRRLFSYDCDNVFVFYNDFHGHLCQHVPKPTAKGVELDDIESYSCEYNQSKDFDLMFT